jgi:anti-sigma B factor antagonist
MDLGIRSTVIEGVPVLNLDGEADLASLPQLYEHVRRFVSGHPGRRVVVDLDGLGYLDPVTVGVLVGARLQARASGGDVQLVCTSPSVARVFTESDLDATFALHPTVSEAARSSAL